jgi:hypothetical protein
MLLVRALFRGDGSSSLRFREVHGRAREPWRLDFPACTGLHDTLRLSLVPHSNTASSSACRTEPSIDRDPPSLTIDSLAMGAKSHLICLGDDRLEPTP